MMTSYHKKIVLLGEGAVGKTSLVRRFVDSTFSDDYIATIGANFKKKIVQYPENNLEVTLMIADLIGQQGYERTQKTNMKGSNGALMVCDLTRLETAKSLEDYWIPLINEVVGESPIIFLANKSDLIDPKSEEAREYRAELLFLSEKYNSKFYFTSAKTGENVETAFRDIGLLSINYKPKFYYDDSLYKTPHWEISTTTALDLIKAQLYHELGGEEFVNSILQTQLPKIGIDITQAPTKEQLEKLVEVIKDIEKSFLPEDKIKGYYIKRRGILAKVA